MVTMTFGEVGVLTSCAWMAGVVLAVAVVFVLAANARSGQISDEERKGKVG
jgi:hypothetical protein